jgi:hypothetical protein
MAAIKYIDMYKDFLTIVRKSRVGTVEPKEFTSFINLAQEEAISTRLQVMDLNKKFMDDLLPLRKTATAVAVTLETATSTRYRTGLALTPTDCRRIARVVVNISSTIEVKTNLIKSNEISSIVDGVFSKPTTKNCYYHLDRVTTVDHVRLFVPIMTYASLYPKCKLEYYTTPTAITEVNVVSSSETCVFNKEVCTDIVNIAARMYLESVQDARYQTFNNELKQKN